MHDNERQPLSKIFTTRLTNQGELSWFEIRALASIGAALIMRHQGDRKAIEKLARLACWMSGADAIDSAMKSLFSYCMRGSSIRKY